MKLNLGAGGIAIPGYESIDLKDGRAAYPLPDFRDGSVDEIRASHLLEHFPAHESLAVLAEWARVLKPGGKLKIAVPNLDWIIDKYRAGQRQYPIEGYLMGGHVDENDVHHAIFNPVKLKALLEAAGLVNVREWKSEVEDCAALEVSLNLEGYKPTGAITIPEPTREQQLRVTAVMSVPRLGFMDNFYCSFQGLVPNRIPLHKFTGAYWHQCIQRGFEAALAEGEYDAILAIDYDTVFRPDDVARLIALMAAHPEADAIAPIQMGRNGKSPLLSMRGPDGELTGQVEWTTFEPDLAKIRTAHFGLTLIRTSALAKLPKPWFVDVCGDDGRWEDGRIDADVNFWVKWEQAGNSLYLANRIPVGHAELLFIWPDKKMQATYQFPDAFYESKGAPQEAWK